ncbi:MAG: cob(I)yrinic acid a,c-diamide adenosyltransferase [Desulfobacterales bacterium]|nr:cob(I)yrinic acid a,c-diamide adenosyltransferase [Desulfobacterales bacterium]
MKSYVQIYTGDGKGKTTAAIGLAVRAAGHGMKTYIGQFMKRQHYGELTSLQHIPGITVEQYGDIQCIHREEVEQKHIDQAVNGLARASETMCSDQYDIIVLDEINVAIWFGLLHIKDVLKFLEKRPENVEVILTGRRAPRELIEHADLVSEMNEIKHYYTDGVQARNGIER